MYTDHLWKLFPARFKKINLAVGKSFSNNQLIFFIFFLVLCLRRNEGLWTMAFFIKQFHVQVQVFKTVNTLTMRRIKLIKLIPWRSRSEFSEIRVKCIVVLKTFDKMFVSCSIQQQVVFRELNTQIHPFCWWIVLVKLA